MDEILAILHHYDLIRNSRPNLWRPDTEARALIFSYIKNYCQIKIIEADGVLLGKLPSTTSFKVIYT